MGRFKGYLIPALLLLALVHWIGTGIWMVNQNEQGIVLRFGRAARTVSAGIQFTLPWPCESLVRVPTTEVRTLSIGFTQAGVQPLDEEVQWLSGDTNIIELQARVLYTVKDPVAYRFGVAASAGDRSRDGLIRQATESVLTELLATLPIDEVLAGGKTHIQLQATGQVQTLVDSFRLGVRIAAVDILQANPPVTVIAAFNDISSARADRARNINEAEGYASQLLPQSRSSANTLLQEAESYRAAMLGQARGSAESFKKLLFEVRKNPQLAKQRLWLEAVERLAARGRIIVFEPAADGKAVRLYVEE
jgi:membrane protease subunit HflK